jgi:hypothetical protein
VGIAWRKALLGGRDSVMPLASSLLPVHMRRLLLVPGLPGAHVQAACTRSLTGLRAAPMHD